jgi:2-polyprenyl-6-hydroxyphenyl methylase/3-demethylubiquinone-9 3-methyltransferase
METNHLDNVMPGIPSFDELVGLLRNHGGTRGPDLYLAQHYQRFVVTLEEFTSTWSRERGRRVLDVGAHWLHQAVLWRHAGFEVTAVDLPGTFEVEGTRKVAEAFDISLLKCPNLELAREFENLPDNSVDVVLFTEILEHITFNPVLFWHQVYRVLAPGGRILVTTPNYYSWKGRAWNMMRFLRGMGGGISVDAILGTHTHGHHWREFSKGEILRYFELLSPDFTPAKSRLLPSYARPRVRWKRVVQSVLDQMPPLRPHLHVEIELRAKTSGIVIEPSW